MAVDVFWDDPGTGRYRVHPSSCVRRWIFWDRPEDLPELDELRDLIESRSTSWLGAPPHVNCLGPGA